MSWLSESYRTYRHLGLVNSAPVGAAAGAETLESSASSSVGSSDLPTIVLLETKESKPSLPLSGCGLPFIRSGQNHLARHGERGKKTRQTEEEVGRQRQGMDRPGVCQVPEGSGEHCKIDETGCKIICGAPMILVVKG